MINITKETRYSIPFISLEERITKEAPYLSSALGLLREAIGPHDFEKYINSLVSLRKVDDQLLIITKREMYRSIIMSRFLPAIMASFDVKVVRVINQ